MRYGLLLITHPTVAKHQSWQTSFSSPETSLGKDRITSACLEEHYIHGNLVVSLYCMLVKSPFAFCLFGHLRQFLASTVMAATSDPSRVRPASSALSHRCWLQWCYFFRADKQPWQICYPTYLQSANPLLLEGQFLAFHKVWGCFRLEAGWHGDCKSQGDFKFDLYFL